MSGLHTIFCHKCGKAMTYPYMQSDELYHKWCLPLISSPSLIEDILNPYLGRMEILEHYNANVDEAIQQPWSVQ